jgi:hypothetical protein
MVNHLTVKIYLLSHWVALAGFLLGNKFFRHLVPHCDQPWGLGSGRRLAEPGGATRLQRQGGTE